MQTPRGAGVPTSCPADSYSKSGGIARVSDSSVQFGCHLPDDNHR